MTEYVRIPTDQLGIMASLVRTVGLPTPQYEMEDELIGPYLIEGQSGFLKYNAGQTAWSWVEADTPHPGLDDIPGLIGDDLLHIREVMDTLAEAVPMELPADRSKTTKRSAFTYGPWRFAWVFVPELKRWELAPLGYA